MYSKIYTGIYYVQFQLLFVMPFKIINRKQQSHMKSMASLLSHQRQERSLFLQHTRPFGITQISICSNKLQIKQSITVSTSRNFGIRYITFV